MAWGYSSVGRAPALQAGGQGFDSLNPVSYTHLMFGIPAGCIVGTLKVLLDRIEEIGKGEEDAYRNY